jgi:hypothetical protein
MQFAAPSVRLASALISLGLAAGCGSKGGEKAGPTTMPSSGMSKADAPVAPMTMEGATHTVASEQPYYKSGPTQATPSAGLLKAGTQVKLLVPGATYSKVEISGRAAVYTSTEALQPI